MAEIAGVSEAALWAFSQRRAQVLVYLERRGGSGFYAGEGGRDRDAGAQGAARAAPVVPGVGGACGRARPRPAGAEPAARPHCRARARRARGRRDGGAACRPGGPDEDALVVQRRGRGHGLGRGADPGSPDRAGALPGRALPRDGAGLADRVCDGRAGRPRARIEARPRADRDAACGRVESGARGLPRRSRQRDELERRALALLREGRSRDYLATPPTRGGSRLPLGGSRRRPSSSPTGGRPAAPSPWGAR